jgi:hypothetical protein
VGAVFHGEKLDCFECEGMMIRDSDDRCAVICVECGYRFVDPDCTYPQEYTGDEDEEECEE